MILVILVSLLITIIIHELAHCWGAYKYGYKPAALIFGFGPRLFRFRVNGIPTTINLLPFGAGVELPPSFDNEKWYRKIVVDAAGPLINLIISFLGLSSMVFILLLINGSTFVTAITGVIQFIVGFSSIGNELLTAFEPGVLVGIGMEKEATKWGELLNSDLSWSNALISFFTMNLVLGICNLLPFPALDGAHIVEDIVNGITGRRFPKIIDNIGFIIIMILSTVYIVTLLGYPVIYTWMTVGIGVVLGVINFIRKKKRFR